MADRIPDGEIDIASWFHHKPVMIKVWERWVWLGIVLIAIFGGAAAGSRKSNGENPDSKPAAPRISTSSRGADKLSSRSGGGESKEEKEIRQMANHALSTPSRTERYRRVMLMLDRTTADNWSILWKEYIRQTLVEGRIHENEWSLFMNRVGEVAGLEAMEYFSHNGQSEFTFNRREVLIGWAAIDPDGALAWMKSKPANEMPAELWGAMMAGAASKDSSVALKLLSEVPESHSLPVVRQTVDTLIQTEGLEKTVALLEKLAGEVPEGEAMPRRLQVFYKEIQQRAGRMDWLAKSYPDMPVRAASLEKLKASFEPGQQAGTGTQDASE